MTHSNQVPPPGGRWDNDRGKHDWRSIAAMVSAHPSEWLMVARDVASGTAQNVRNGKVIPLRDLGGKIEAVMRGSRLRGTTRYGDLYLRWTPEDGGEDE